MIIENYKGVLEYEEFYIRINTLDGIININGFELQLNQLTDEAVSITGKIESIDIERKEE
ncbi:MAG: YabP/YqfC family sporulation protein [Clostridia bacterium]|nr:YabP/YqfC family sporulation protein [Clostridia bacterium]